MGPFTAGPNESLRVLRPALFSARPESFDFLKAPVVSRNVGFRGSGFRGLGIIKLEVFLGGSDKAL